MNRHFKMNGRNIEEYKIGLVRGTSGKGRVKEGEYI
jgi:hypothetical protein